ncbi:MAG: hypothetical protein IKT52_09780 [Oscillospiraceae bacterium]|nr:hypothetical protein [Oscillospiraceae bacterium]
MKNAYQKLLKLETTPEALEATIQYLTGRIKPFLSTLEPVLICYPDEGSLSLGGVFKEAVLRCEAKPVFWGSDYRWKELLRLAFDTHANTIVGSPLVILGLMKLARATATPLYVYDAIVCGDPFAPWMVEGLKKGLDCNTWGCYAVRSGPVIGGFSCAQEVGIHIREDVFKPCLYHSGAETSNPNRGRLYFESAKDPSLTYDPEVTVLIHHQNCCCGCEEPRVVDVKPTRKDDLLREHLESQLLTWSSVLDYQVEYTESGAALELVVFPGEAIPQLPSFAKQKVRFWNPNADIPFCMRAFSEKIQEKEVEYH